MSVLASLSATLADQVNHRSAREVPAPKLSTLAATEYRVWERQVQEVALLNRWSDTLTQGQVNNLRPEEKAARITRMKRGVLFIFAALEGDLAEATAHLSSSTYATVGEALKAIRDLVITPAGAQLAEEEFRTARQDAGESLLKFAAKVRNRFNAAYPGENCDSSREAKRQFIVNLQNRGLSRELARRCPIDLTSYADIVAQAQHLYAADLMVQGRASGVQRDPPQVNAMTGHFGATAGTKKNKGWNPGKGKGASGGKGHNDSEARRNQDGVLRDRRGAAIECYQCRGNHYKRNCPQASSTTKRSSGPGHRAINEISEGYEEDEEAGDLDQLENEVFGSGN